MSDFSISSFIVHRIVNHSRNYVGIQKKKGEDLNKQQLIAHNEVQRFEFHTIISQNWSK